MKIPRLSDPRFRRVALPVTVIAVGAAGTGAAVAATGGDSSSTDSGAAGVAGGPVVSVAGGPIPGKIGGPPPLPTPAEAADERDAFFADVAKRLGVDQSDLEQGLESASIDRIEANGRLSDAQKAQIEKQIRSGDLPAGPVPFGGAVAFAAPPPGGDPMAAAADYLGLTPKELFAKLGDGTSLADLADAHGKSVDGLKQAILDNARQDLDKAVEADKMSADDRDRILQDLSSGVDDLVNGTAPPPPPLQGRGKGGRGFSLSVPAPGLRFPRAGGHG